MTRTSRTARASSGAISGRHKLPLVAESASAGSFARLFDRREKPLTTLCRLCLDNGWTWLTTKIKTHASMNNTRRLSKSPTPAAALFVLFAFAVATRAQTPPPVDSYQRLADSYLDGKWDEVEDMFATPGRELQAVAPAHQAELAYIRRALSEGRPAWWKRCKAGEKLAFIQTVWGRPLRATYDPNGKASIQSSYTRNSASLTLTWPAADMDNPAHAEHGFSKGDLTALTVWTTLGMAEAFGAVPLQSQANLKEDKKLLLQQYFDFRGDVAGVYYGTPRARRWGLWLYMAMYMEKYAKMPIRTSREAVAVSFMSEVVANPARYPSIKLPASLPAEGAEETLAADLRGWIEKHGWTVAEDKSIRDAIAALATTNTRQVNQIGDVTLPNGLLFAFDPEKDKAFRQKRDVWFKTKLDAAPPAH